MGSTSQALSRDHVSRKGQARCWGATGAQGTCRGTAQAGTRGSASRGGREAGSAAHDPRDHCGLGAPHTHPETTVRAPRPPGAGRPAWHLRGHTDSPRGWEHRSWGASWGATICPWPPPTLGPTPAAGPPGQSRPMADPEPTQATSRISRHLNEGNRAAGGVRGLLRGHCTQGPCRLPSPPIHLKNSLSPHPQCSRSFCLQSPIV